MKRDKMKRDTNEKREEEREMRDRDITRRDRQLRHVSNPNNPPDELSHNDSEKNPRGTNNTFESSESCPCFHLFFLIRIRIFGPRE